MFGNRLKVVRFFVCSRVACGELRLKRSDAIVKAAIFVTLRGPSNRTGPTAGPATFGLNQLAKTILCTQLGDCFRWVRRRQVKGVAKWAEKNDGCEPGFVTERNELSRLSCFGRTWFIDHWVKRTICVRFFLRCSFPLKTYRLRANILSARFNRPSRVWRTSGDSVRGRQSIPAAILVLSAPVVLPIRRFGIPIVGVHGPN